MIVDWIISIPYYIALLFIPESIWDSWINDIRYELIKAGGCFSSEFITRSAELKKTLKGKLINRRYPFFF